jgi:hypothetical protein
MNTAENIQMLIDGGYESQAKTLAESQSLWIEEDSTGREYGFSDGSSIKIGGEA